MSPNVVRPAPRALGSLFVEGLKLRPSAERVLAALHELDGDPHPVHIQGAATSEIAKSTGLDPHVVRARLTDLRRLGLIVSGRLRRQDEQHVHVLTPEGLRRGRHMTGASLGSRHPPKPRA